MKLPREVVVRIRPDGKVEVETLGFVGSSCAEVAAYLERLLTGDHPDADDVRREWKAEYYLAEKEEEVDVRDRGPNA